MPANQVKVFIAGSKKLAEQRHIFRSVLMRLQNLFDVMIQTKTFEDFSDSVINGGHQKALYNKHISKEADIVVFVIDECIGRYTKQEFDVAYKSYKQRDFPKIFVYCKTDEKCSTTNVAEFKKEVESKQQYYTEYIDNNDLEHLFNNSMTDFLVTTMLKKPIRRSTIHFNKKGSDMLLGKFKLSQRVSDIFTANNISDAITAYSEIISDLNKILKTQKTGSQISKSLNELNIVKDFSDTHLQRSKLSNFTETIRNRINDCKKIDRLLLQLGLLLCYFYLDEPILTKRTLDEMKSTPISQSNYISFGLTGKVTDILFGGGVFYEILKEDVAQYNKCYISLYDIICSISLD